MYFYKKGLIKVSKKLIDIDLILQNKVPKYYKFIPTFIIRYLKKIVHQDELNFFLSEAKCEPGLGFLKESLDFLGTHIIVKGEENLPKGGRYTFVSNHPLGGQDGLAIAHVLGQHYGENIKFIVNDLLMNIDGLAPLFIPINKTGKQNRDFARMVDKGFESDNQMIMFPAGLCSRRQNGVIRDLEWKKTFIVKSVECQRDIVPIYFEGRNSDFFYRMANIGKWLGLKFNIAMIYLPDEMFKNRNKTFTITVGKPIPWQTFDRTKTAKEWAQVVKERVYKLKA